MLLLTISVFTVVHMAQPSTIGRSCSLDDECARQMICSNGFCLPAAPIPNICSRARTCPFPARCRYKTCWLPIYTACADNADCEPNLVCRYGFCDIDPVVVIGPRERCSSHDDCPEAQICLQSRCKPASSKGVACWSDSECADGNEGCKFGFCWRAHAAPELEVKESNSKSENSATCIDHAECSQAAICYDQHCRKAKPSELSCTTDVDCKPQGACKYAYCWTISDHVATSISGLTNENGKRPQCVRHEQCGLTKVCSSKDRICVPAYPVGKVCLNVYDCDYAEECKESICWRKGETGKEENEDCHYHSDCNGYAICLDYVCIAAVPTEIKCENDAVCPDMASGCKYDRCWIAFDEQGAESNMDERLTHFRHRQRALLGRVST